MGAVTRGYVRPDSRFLLPTQVKGKGAGMEGNKVLLIGELRVSCMECTVGIIVLPYNLGG